MARLAPSNRLLRDRRGSIAVQTALLLVVLVGFAAFGVEITNLMLQQRRMQAAADAAAMAGGQAGRTLAQAQGDAIAIAGRHGYVSGQQGTTVTVSRPASGNAGLEVVIAKSFPPLLLAVLTNQPIDVRVRSISNQIAASKGCMLALDATGSRAVTILNSASIINSDCELVVNSSFKSTVDGALYLENNANISGPIYLVSNYFLGGNNASITGLPLITNAGTPVADPYASITLPTAPACNGQNGPFGGTITLQPGHYCNGITISNNARVTLNTGVYFIDGTFSLGRNASVTGNRVTVLFNSATTTTVSNGVTLRLTAPLLGTTAGLAIASRQSGNFSFQNTSSIGVEGAIYLPNMTATINAADTGNSPCTQLIANRLVLGSQVNLRADCSGTAVRPIGRAQPVLVE